MYLLELRPAGYAPLAGTCFKTERLYDPSNEYPAGIAGTRGEVTGTR